MGRIKTALIKRVSMDLYKEHGNELKKSFDENKALVGGYLNISSKKLRNVIAGYVTRLMNTKED